MSNGLHIAPGFDLPVDAVTETFGILGQRTPSAWAWAAGLFEGEGCIRHDPSSSTRALHIAMTDLDVLQRFQAVVDAGSLLPRKVTGNRKPCWIWKTSRWRDVNRILNEFLPYLGDRRRAKALALLADPATKQGEVCPAGHPLVGPGADVYAYGKKRMCAVCHRARARARRAA